MNSTQSLVLEGSIDIDAAVVEMESLQESVLSLSANLDRLADMGGFLTEANHILSGDLTDGELDHMQSILKAALGEDICDTLNLTAGNEGFGETVVEAVKQIFVGIYRIFSTLFKKIGEFFGLISKKGFGGIKQAVGIQAKSCIDMSKLIAESTGSEGIIIDTKNDTKEILKALKRKANSDSFGNVYGVYRDIVKKRLELLDGLEGSNLAEHRDAERRRLKSGTRLGALGNVEGTDDVMSVYSLLGNELVRSEERIETIVAFVRALKDFDGQNGLGALLTAKTQPVSYTHLTLPTKA